MKKILKVFVLCAMAGIVLLNGCGTKLSGSQWETKEAIVDGEKVSKEVLEEQLGEIEIVFVDDTSFVMTGGGKSMEGTYTADGSKITMILEGGTIQEAEVNGNELKLLSTNGRAEWNMEKK